jgi:hypothetical protein
MSVSSYNTNPALNTSISGIDISEGSAASGYNNALRQIMADIKAWTDGQAITYPISVANGGTGATTAAAALVALGGFPVGGGSILGNLTVNGDIQHFTNGRYAYFASTSMTGARIYVQAIGADPTSQPGDVVFEY